MSRWVFLRVLMLLLSSVGALYFFQEKLIFFAQKTDPGFRYSFQASFEERILDVDGDLVHSLLFRRDNPKGIILYFHGNAGNLESWGYVGDEITMRTGWDVWIIDYPGFGKSTGTIKSEAQMHLIAEKFMEAIENEFPNAKKLIYGRSIGTGMAVRLATKAKINGLLLETPYDSLRELVQEKFPYLPVPWLLKYQFMNNKNIINISQPIWIIHGSDDELIPFHHGKKLSDRIKNRTQFTEVQKGQHNNLSDFPEYWTSLANFLKTI